LELVRIDLGLKAAFGRSPSGAAKSDRWLITVWRDIGPLRKVGSSS
jgi:hypothetical protein